MAYSGTTTFAATLQQICTRAYAKLGALDASLGETMDAQALLDFTFTLNVIIKETMASASGVLLWSRSFNTLFLQQGQFEYNLGASGDNWTTAYSSTTLTGNGVLGASNLTVSSIAGFTNGQFIGVKLDSGVTFWTTISGAPSGTTIHLASTLPSQATAGNWVYAYTTKADRPQTISTVTRANTSDIDTILTVMSAAVYQQLPNKGQPVGQNVNPNPQLGTPIMWYYQPNLINGNFYVWQPPQGTNGYDRLTLYVDTILQDITGVTDNPWVPIEWVNYLIWQLAAEMADEYADIPESKITRLFGIAGKKLEALKNYCSSQSKEPIQFGISSEATSQWWR